MELRPCPLQAPSLWQSQRSSGSYSWSEETTTSGVYKWSLRCSVFVFSIKSLQDILVLQMRNQELECRLLTHWCREVERQRKVGEEECSLPRGQCSQMVTPVLGHTGPVLRWMDPSLYRHHLTLLMFIVLYSALFIDVILKTNVLSGVS